MKFCTILMVLFSSAGFVIADTFTLVSDNYWNSMLEVELYNDHFEGLIKKVSDFVPFMDSGKIRIQGTTIGREIVEIKRSSNDLQAVISAVESAGAKVILSPLLAVYACETATKYPDKEFFVPSVQIPGECTGDNVYYYEFDYTGAFYKAGEWAAGRTGPVHAVFYTGSNPAKNNLEAFLNGWGSVKAVTELDISKFTDPDNVDSDYIRNYSERIMEDSGVAAVFAGPLSVDFLNSFDGSSVALIGAHLSGQPENGYNYAGSIEIPPGECIAQIIKFVSIGTYDKGQNIKADFFLPDTP